MILDACFEPFQILATQMNQENPWAISRHVLASGEGLHCEGGSQSGLNGLCFLIKESENYYMGQWERSIYHHLIFKKTEFQITKNHFTRAELLDLIKTDYDYRWQKDRILENYKP